MATGQDTGFSAGDKSGTIEVPRDMFIELLAAARAGEVYAVAAEANAVSERLRELVCRGAFHGWEAGIEDCLEQALEGGTQLFRRRSRDIITDRTSDNASAVVCQAPSVEGRAHA